MTPPRPKKAVEAEPGEEPEEKQEQVQEPPPMSYAQQVALRRKLREKYH
ncbi:hypothetical protein KOI35_42580 [Actinoplanes bogorensis]|uniref:Uncharacterized protein n=1 Tax=Paractinoplanes bogorensis TaxID=1610840 RepID=A0ABS5Z3G2_9ACTN|nr:hypothetical protein [Actinoplanes bogorensis]MBU2670208.1 hypothetical protein [Actinoplanes bogorensis]